MQKKNTFVLSRFQSSLAILFALFLLIFSSCQPRTFVEMSDLKCQLPTELRNYLKDNDIFGCLVVLWEHQSENQSLSKAILLNSEGKIQTRTDEGKSQAITLNIPANATGTKTLFRLYLFEMISEIKKMSLETHRARCATMGLPSYRCFQPNNKEGCAYVLQLKPTIEGSHYEVASIGEKGSKATCRVCSREVCDGKDNNCNGQIDEYDEVKNQPCPKKKP